MILEEVKRVGVVGCGTIGSGIAIAAVKAGYEVTVQEVSPEAAAEGWRRIDRFFLAGIKKGKTTEEQRQTYLSQIKLTTDRAEMKHCLSLHHRYGSSFRATGQGRRNALLQPAPLMKLVEVVRALQTSDNTFHLAWQFAQRLGKDPIAAKDMPGFVEDRLFVPFLLNAVRAYQDGLASQEDIDKACVLGLGHPMGPLRAMDMFGIDLFLPICEALYEEFKEPQYAIPPLLRRMIEAGHTGFKAGKGFYEYPPEQLSVY